MVVLDMKAWAILESNTHSSARGTIGDGEIHETRGALPNDAPRQCCVPLGAHCCIGLRGTKRGYSARYFPEECRRFLPFELIRVTSGAFVSCSLPGILRELGYCSLGMVNIHRGSPPPRHGDGRRYTPPWEGFLPHSCLESH